VTVTPNRDSDNNSPATGQLLLATGLVAVCLAPAGYFIAGVLGFAAVSITVACCVLPLVVVRFLPIARGRGHLGLLLANGIRMALTLAVCIIVKERWPSVGFNQFYLWVVLVYLALLVVDTFLVLRSLPLTRKASS